MFIGEYQHNVDLKGRLAIPVKFRPDLAQGAVVTRGLDGCLFLFTTEEWQVLATKVRQLPLTEPKARAFVRMMFAGAAELLIDKQGRINVPAHLLEFAKISKETVIAGLLNRIEVWDAKAWKAYQEQAESETDSIAMHLSNLGI